MFEILESHSNQTLSEVEDENSHLQTIILQLIHSIKKKNSVDNIYHLPFTSSRELYSLAPTHAAGNC